MNAIRKVSDRLWTVLSIAAVCLAAIPLVSIIVDVIERGLPAINWTFLTALPGDVLQPGGLSNAIQGTLILVALGSAIGIPIGVLSGVYIAEYGNGRLGGFIRFLGDVQAGISSIVVGLVIYCLVVLTFHRFSALAGGLALGIMIIPITSNTTTAALRAVPGSVREASLALGIRKWRTALLVVANAKAGIATGVLLSIARITGETAPILLTALNSTQSFRGLDNPVASLTVYIYQYGLSPFKVLQTQAWGAALLLMLIVLGINVAVRYWTRGGSVRGY